MISRDGEQAAMEHRESLPVAEVVGFLIRRRRDEKRARVAEPMLGRMWPRRLPRWHAVTVCV